MSCRSVLILILWMKFHLSVPFMDQLLHFYESLLCLDSCPLLVFSSTCSDTRNPVPFWLFSDCVFIHCLSFIFILKIVLNLYFYFNVLYCIVTVFAWSSSETWNPALVPFLLFIVISLCLSSRVIQRVFTDNRYLEKRIITTNILSVKDNQLKLWCLSWSVITILYFQNGADFVFINPSIILLHNDVFKALHTMHFRKFSTSFQLLIVHVVL